jgi:hypothetical protein
LSSGSPRRIENQTKKVEEDDEKEEEEEMGPPASWQVAESLNPVQKSPLENASYSA